MTIDAASITWICTRALPDRLASTSPGTDVATLSNYLFNFPNSNEQSGWQWPWLRDLSFSRFWSRNLGANYQRGVEPLRAWRRQVPLREASPPVLSTSQAGVKVTAERYVFPSGIGVTIRLDVTGPLDEGGLLDSLTGAGSAILVAGAPNPAATLPQVIDRLLDDAGSRVGFPDSGYFVQNTPIVVATITGTKGWSQAPIPIESAGPAHRFLDALSRGSRGPLTGQVGDLAASLLDSSGSFPNTVLFMLDKRLCIWSPAQSEDSSQRHKLLCYHENQSLAALHAGISLDAVQWADEVGPGSMSADLRETLKPIATALGLQYGKVRDVYASRFVRRLIDDSGLMAAIGGLRTNLGVGGPLA